MIVTTAGHVDHGKTALVRALTGVETDRLPEERARGMSIDLGFAYCPTPGGGVLGLVDVPGHERFIRNMVAGVAGVDSALLVVAADDGPMPQTHEHLRILRWLGVPLCAVAISKADRVEGDRLEGLASSLSHLAGPDVPLFIVSSLSGNGVPALRAHLLAAADATRVREPSGHARLAIDRAYHREGRGLVVTGTVHSGTIRRDDMLVLAPGGETVRVRGLQIAGGEVEEVAAGRCAVNLAGAPPASAIVRGQWLLHQRLCRQTQALHARVTLRAEDGKLPRSGAKIQVHVGAAVADATLQYRDSVEPDRTFTVRLRFEAPFFALRGDRLLIRDRNATRTIGGGIVTDPFPAQGRRARGLGLKDVPGEAAPEEALRSLTAIDQAPVELDTFEIAFNLDPARAEQVTAAAGVTTIEARSGRLAIGPDAAARAREAVNAAVALHHARDPSSPGLALARLSVAVGPLLPGAILDALARRMVERGELEVVGAALRLPAFRESITEEESAIWDRARPLLTDRGHGPWRQKDLADALAMDEESLAPFLARGAALGKVVRLAQRVFADASVVRELAAAAARLGGSPDARYFKAGAFRDATGLNRRTAIQVLEYFDCVGLTLRKGDERRLLRLVEDVFGEGGHA